MEVLDAAAVRAGLDPVELVAALREVFGGDGVTVPERTLQSIGSDSSATLLVKPAWGLHGLLGVKVATHHPANGGLGLPSIHATYLLLDESTGAPMAVLDGTELTRWRTAAASALAADHLARDDVEEHLLVGAGNVAASIPACYAAVRDVHLTRVWARQPEQAEALAAQLREEGVAAEAVEDLRAAVRTADVITSATSATRPLILGKDVSPGTHVDLIGSFTPDMVEADEALVTRARVVVDVPEARHTCGELAGPLRRGTLTEEDVAVTLADLACGRDPGRRDEPEVTVFKSVGTAAEDLAAAVLVWRATTSS